MLVANVAPVRQFLSGVWHPHRKCRCLKPLGFSPGARSLITIIDIAGFIQELIAKREDIGKELAALKKTGDARSPAAIQYE